MKKISYLAIVAIILIGTGCVTFNGKETHSAVEPDSCGGIPKLKWQTYSRGFDAKEALDLATKLTVAAKADAEKLKKITEVSAEAKIGLTSQLSKIINLNVKQESKVSEEFWEQDLTYRQSLCYLDSLITREDLTPKQKNKVINEILEFSKSRRKYMFQYAKKEKIEVSSLQSYLKNYGFSTISIIDLNIKNRGTFPENITKIKVNVKEVSKYNYDPCPICMRHFAEGVYNIAFKNVLDGIDEYLIPHVIEPDNIERINLVFGGDFSGRESYLARITLSIYAGSGGVIETNPVDILVQNFDQGTLLPINQVDEAELREFIGSGTTASTIITPTVIRKYFSDGRSRGAFGARLPSLPDWFKS